MSSPVDASRRRWAALGLALGFVLTLLLPALVTSEVAMPSIAGAVLAVVALLVAGSRSAAVAGCARLGLTVIGAAPPLVLGGRVTDTTHQPLRPRAPGLG